MKNNIVLLRNKFMNVKLKLILIQIFINESFVYKKLILISSYIYIYKYLNKILSLKIILLNFLNKIYLLYKSILLNIN